MTAPAIVTRGKSNGRAPAVDLKPEYGRVVLELPVESIEIGENVRKAIDEAAIDELAATITQVGVLQPIKVVQTERNGGLGKYLVVYGQRRLLAARKAGLATIPAIVDYQRLEQERESFAFEQLVENLVRADLNPIDEAKALRAILDADTQLTQAALAERLGRSAPWVSNALRLLELAKPVRDLIAAGQLGGAHGKVLAGLDKGEQEAIAKAAAKQGASVRDLDELIDRRRRERKHQADLAAAAAKRVKAAVDAVIAKKIDPSAPIVVSGYDNGAVADALRKAGFTGVRRHEGYYYGSTPPPSICKCVAWRLETGYGTPRVTRHCVDEKHRAELSKRENAKQKRESDERQARREAARASLRAELEAHPLSLELARHVLWRFGAMGWEKPKQAAERWQQICGLSLEQLHAQIEHRFYEWQEGPPIDVTTEASEASA